MTEGANQVRTVVSQVLAVHFGLPFEELGSGTRLGTDLGFDSLQMLEVMIILEKGTGSVLPIDEIPPDATIDELARLVSDACAKGSQVSAED